jgi:hypothetical protein
MQEMVKQRTRKKIRTMMLVYTISHAIGSSINTIQYWKFAYNACIKTKE